MNSPVRVPQFADGPVKTFLQGEFADTAVRKNLPDDWTTNDGPVLIVADDGGPQRFPVATKSTVRLTGYATGQDAARALVTKAWGLVLCRVVPGLAAARPGIRPYDAGKDPEHPAAFLASATVIATVRTTTI